MKNFLTLHFPEEYRMKLKKKITRQKGSKNASQKGSVNSLWR